MKLKNHMTPRRTLLWALPTALLLLFAFGAPRAEAAPGDNLKGKWKAIAMELGGKRQPVKKPMSITFQFKAGGKFKVVISNGKRDIVQNGTWSATAAKLTMTIGGKTETADYKVAGSKLTMKKSIGGRTATYHMKKLP